MGKEGTEKAVPSALPHVPPVPIDEKPRKSSLKKTGNEGRGDAPPSALPSLEPVVFSIGKYPRKSSLKKTENQDGSHPPPPNALPRLEPVQVSPTGNAPRKGTLGPGANSGRVSFRVPRNNRALSTETVSTVATEFMRTGLKLRRILGYRKIVRGAGVEAATGGQEHESAIEKLGRRESVVSVMKDAGGLNSKPRKNTDYIKSTLKSGGAVKELFNAKAKVTDTFDLKGLLSYADSPAPHLYVDESNLVARRPTHPWLYEAIRLGFRIVWLTYQMSALIGCFFAPGTLGTLCYWLFFTTWELETNVGNVHDFFPYWMICVLWTISIVLVMSPRSAPAHFTAITFLYNSLYILLAVSHIAWLLSSLDTLSWDLVVNNWVTIAYYSGLALCFFVHGELFYIQGFLTFFFGLIFFMFMLPFWYLLNTVYTIANLDDFTWGTREETVEKVDHSGLSNAEREVSVRAAQAELSSVKRWKFVIVVWFVISNYLCVIGLLQQTVTPNPLTFVLALLVIFSLPVFWLSVLWGLVAAVNVFQARIHGLFFRTGPYNRERMWWYLSKQSYGEMRPWERLPKFLSDNLNEDGWKQPPLHEFRTDDMLIMISKFVSFGPIRYAYHLVRRFLKVTREKENARRASIREAWEHDQPVKENWDRLVVLICAYNEGEEEVNRTMDSVKYQLWHDVASLEGKQQADVIIVIDGDNELTRPCQQFFRAAMKRLSRDHNLVIIEDGRACRADFADNVRVYLIVKKTNKRKRHTHDVLMSYLFQKEWQEGVPATVVFLDTDSSWSNLSLARLYKHLYMNRHVGGVTGSVSFRAADAWQGAWPIWKSMWPMILVWAQRFEFASGQIFVKAAESMCGSYVSCLPGAFCMVRTAALKHVFRSYTKNATGLLYRNCLDLGEDRYMTTLILLRGWGVEYVRGVRAETGAVTNVPQLYGQRRRWVSSTLANQVVIFKELCKCSTITPEQKLELQYAHVDPRRFLSVVQLPSSTGRKRLLIEIDAQTTPYKETVQYTLSRTDMEPLIERNFDLTEFGKQVNETEALEVIKKQVKSGDNLFSIILLLAEDIYVDEKDHMYPPGFLQTWHRKSISVGTGAASNTDDPDDKLALSLSTPKKKRSPSSFTNALRRYSMPFLLNKRQNTSDSMLSEETVSDVTVHSRKVYEVPPSVNVEFLEHSSKPQHIFIEEETETNEARRKLWEKTHCPKTVQCPGCEKVFTRGTKYLAILRHCRACALYIAYTKHYKQQKAKLLMSRLRDERLSRTGGFGAFRRRSSIAKLKDVDPVGMELRNQLVLCGLGISCGSGCLPDIEIVREDDGPPTDWLEESFDSTV